MTDRCRYTVYNHERTDELTSPDRQGGISLRSLCRAATGPATRYILRSKPNEKAVCAERVAQLEVHCSGGEARHQQSVHFLVPSSRLGERSAKEVEADAAEHVPRVEPRQWQICHLRLARFRAAPPTHRTAVQHSHQCSPSEYSEQLPQLVQSLLDSGV